MLKGILRSTRTKRVVGMHTFSFQTDLGFQGFRV